MQSLTRFASLGGRLDCGPQGNVLMCAGRYKRLFKGPLGEKGHHGTTTTLFANSEGAFGATFTQQLDTNTHLGAEILVQNSEVRRRRRRSRKKQKKRKKKKKRREKRGERERER